MKLVLDYMRPYRRRTVSALTLKAVSTIVELTIPMVFSHMIDVVAPRGSIREVVLWGILMLAIALVAAVTGVKSNRGASAVACDTTRDIRHDLFIKTESLSARQVDRVSVPSLEARLTNDTYNIINLINMMQRLGVRAPILLIGGLTMTFTFEPRLTLVIICLLPFVFLTVWTVSRKGFPLWKNVQGKADGMVRKVRENTTGIRVIKALDRGESEEKEFDGVVDMLSKAETRAQITMGATSPIMNLIFNTGLVGIVLIGAWLVDRGMTTKGTIVAFLSYISLILQAMMSVTRIFIAYTRTEASSARIEEIMEMPEDLSVVPVGRESTDHHIEFRNVSFSYLGRKNNVDDISFCLERGGTLGLIGATGSGKSTVINLLMRLYDRDAGSITIGGEDIRSMSPEVLHSRFGVVFQSDIIFNETIRENIDFGRGLADEAIEKAARVAQALPFIEGYDDGFAHMLNQRGSNLSGGQKQRLLIARALAGEPEILVLDDASSALDYKTDSMFRAGMAESYPDVTKIIVAQRVSSILHSDLILVLDEGKVVGRGRHEELIASCPVYEEIAQSQLGGDFS